MTTMVQMSVVNSEQEKKKLVSSVVVNCGN